MRAASLGALALAAGCGLDFGALRADAGRDAAAGPDAGMDGSREAGMDAGRDAGDDAGGEAGIDAGADASVDAAAEDGATDAGPGDADTGDAADAGPRENCAVTGDEDGDGEADCLDTEACPEGVLCESGRCCARRCETDDFSRGDRCGGCGIRCMAALGSVCVPLDGGYACSCPPTCPTPPLGRIQTCSTNLCLCTDDTQCAVGQTCNRATGLCSY